MQIHLFENEDVVRNMRQHTPKVADRKFRPRAHINPMNTADMGDYQKWLYNKAMDAEKLYDSGCEKRYVGYEISDVLDDTRGLLADPYVVQEAMGFGIPPKDVGVCYYCVMDWRLELCYVLKVLCGCDAESIRAVPNYEALSNSLLCGDFNALRNFKFQTLLSIDPNLDWFISKLLNEVNREYGSMSKLQTTYHLLVKFYTDIQRTLANMRDYVVYAYKGDINESSLRFYNNVYISYANNLAVVRGIRPIWEPIELYYKGEYLCTMTFDNYTKGKFLTGEAEIQ